MKAVSWRRIILDECHEFLHKVDTNETKPLFEAVRSLEARNLWVSISLTLILTLNLTLTLTLTPTRTGWGIGVRVRILWLGV